MRVRIIDALALQSPPPRNIRLYLQTHRWERVATSRQRPDVWAHATPEGTYEVLAPSSRNASDYPERVAELLRTLAVVEDRSEQDILRDLLTLGFDVQYIHTWHEGLPGTAPLRDAAEAMEAAHNMLAAAATSLEVPRLVLPHRRPSTTSQFMSRVLAGPTEPGSYVISIWVPVPPRLTQEEDAVLFDPAIEDPRERAATRRLHQALTATRIAAREALDEDAGIDAFTDRVSDGVNANLCEALVAMSGESVTPFHVQFSWALARPVIDIETTRAISFDEELVPVLEEAAAELRESVPEDDVRVRGSVIRLHREGNTGSGDITIAGSIVGEPADRMRRFSLNVSEVDYERAIQAHQNYLDVEVGGSLTRRGTRSNLRLVRGFEVVPDVGTE
jgi:hypothetical protein